MKKLILLGLLMTLTLVGFQNCGDVNFSSTKDPLGGGLGTPEPPGDPGDPGDPSDPTDPTDPTDPPEPICPDGQTYFDGQCIVTIFTECLSFVELQTDMIPSLESTGVCYFKKLIDAVENHPSGSYGEVRDENVLSRMHNRQESDPQNIHPFVLGDASLNLTFFGKRSISFTSSSVGSVSEIEAAKLKIDNYILFEISDELSPKRMLARGTADAEPIFDGVVGRIQVNGESVEDFDHFAPGGTAQVPVVSFSKELVNPNVASEIRVRMLDCGGAAEASNMYIIIH